MTIAIIAAYAIAIFFIVGLSIRLLWLLFIVFLYRGISSVLPYETAQKWFGFEQHWIYFAIVLVLSIALCLLIWRFMREISILQYVIFGLLVYWCFNQYELSDLFFFKDFLQEHNLWGYESIKEQIQQLFNIDKDGYAQIFLDSLGNVFIWFLLNGNKGKKRGVKSGII